jgi:hypothetical protein
MGRGRSCPQLERVRLAQAAGETDRARAMALVTRPWLRRAADDLDRRLALMMGLKLMADKMVVSDAWVRRLAAGDELPAEQRSALLDRLSTRRWREPDSNHRSRSCERLFWALPIGDGGAKGGATYRFRSETAMLAWSGSP